MLKLAMFYCEKCGKKNENNEECCSFCGTKQKTMANEGEMKKCKQCEKQISVSANYCYYCGQDQAEILLKELKQPVEKQENPDDLEKEPEIPTVDISDPKKLKEFIRMAKKEGIEVHVLGKNESFRPGIVASTKLFLKDWINVNKRMGRADFWYGLCGTFLLSMPAGLVISLLASLAGPMTSGSAENVYKLGIAAWIAFFYVALLTAVVRRLHDIELPGYLALLLFFPGGDLIALVISTMPQRRTKSNYTFKDPRKKNKHKRDR